MTATTVFAGRRADARLVHLGDRGGGDRLAELDEETRRSGRPSAISTIAHRLGAGERRHPVLQPLEVARRRDADDVGAGREELAELDVGRPEPGQRRREPGGAVAGVSRARSAARGAGQARAGRRQRARIDERERALARQHEAGADAAGQKMDRRRLSTIDALRSSSRNGGDDAAGQGRWVTRRKPASSIMRAKAAGGGNGGSNSTR